MRVNEAFEPCIAASRAILPAMLRMLPVWFAILLAPAAQATLVVAVPSRNGLVIAADSRLTFLGAPCDGASKILTTVRPGRTVVVVTGDGVFVPTPPRGEDPCRFLATAPRLLDMDAVVARYLNGVGNDPAQIHLADLADACVQAVERFRAAYPEELRGYAGRAIFSVVVGSYDAQTRTSTLRNFVVRIDPQTGRAEAARLSTTDIGPDDLSGVWIYGETDWVARNVYAGAGRAFLTPATQEFVRARQPVSGTSLESAAAIAANLVEAASRTAARGASEGDPPPSGIGGAIRVVVAGLGAHPKEFSSATPTGTRKPSR
jgi:hypothetical protein